MTGYFVTILLSMALKIMPLPALFINLNPDWVLLALIYWTLAIPEKIGVFNAWVVGLLVDVLTGRLLGQHALVYALISFVCLKSHKRLRQYLLPQQSLFVFIALLFSQMLIFWIENIRSPTDFSSAFMLPIIVGTVFWPGVYYLLRFIRILERPN